MWYIKLLDFSSFQKLMRYVIKKLRKYKQIYKRQKAITWGKRNSDTSKQQHMDDITFSLELFKFSMVFYWKAGTNKIPKTKVTILTKSRIKQASERTKSGSYTPPRKTLGQNYIIPNAHFSKSLLGRNSVF